VGVFLLWVWVFPRESQNPILVALLAAVNLRPPGTGQARQRKAEISTDDCGVGARYRRRYRRRCAGF
jgi:hypothetical protein